MLSIVMSRETFVSTWKCRFCAGNGPPFATPKSNRPPDRMSMVATSSATWIGLRKASSTAAEPILTREVTPAR